MPVVVPVVYEKSPVNTGLFAVRTRLELATPCVTGRYSNQLNYRTNWSANLVVFFNSGNVFEQFEKKLLLFRSNLCVGVKDTADFIGASLADAFQKELRLFWKILRIAVYFS